MIYIGNLKYKVYTHAVPYDAEIEYLEGTDTQYIDTGFKHNQNTRFITKINFSGTLSQWTYPFGSFGDIQDNNALLTAEISNTYVLRTYYSSRTSPHNFNISASGTHTFDLNKNVHTVDNTTYTYTATSFQSIYNTYIFASTGYSGNLTISSTTKKIYYFKIYDNETLVRDFIPVRVGQVGYMYDKVSGQLFGNDGTGDFVLGPDVEVVNRARKVIVSDETYIADGLVFHLDGINKGSNENAWTDLVGGVIYNNVSATKLTNGWQFNSSVMRSSTYNFLSPNDNYTIEIVLKPESTAAQALWMPYGDGTITNGTPLLYYNSGVITFLQRRNTYNISFTVNQPCCISLNLDRGLVNGSVITKNSGTDYWNNSSAYSFIGLRNNSAVYYKGTIYAIRAYNRKLTEEEMLHNQRVDNKRFNLGLTI